MKCLLHVACSERPPCRPGEFRCRDGRCIEGFRRCNFVMDCIGKEDEENCTNRCKCVCGDSFAYVVRALFTVQHKFYIYFKWLRKPYLASVKIVLMWCTFSQEIFIVEAEIFTGYL